MLLLALLGAGTGGSAYGQDRLVERIGAAEAPVYEDNLDAARSRAVLVAQHDAIRRLLKELVAPEWLTLFDKEVRRSVLSRPQRYIGSYRVQRLQVSLDRTRYTARVAAQVNRSQLARDLRLLSLPLRGDPLRTLAVFYARGDPAFSDPVLLRAALDALRGRLRLLNFQLEGPRALPGHEAELLANPISDARSRGEFLRRQKVAVGLFLAYHPSPPGQEGTPTLRARLLQAGNGAQLAVFVISARPPAADFSRRGAAFRSAVLSGLVQPLVMRMQPGGIKAFGPATGQAAPLKLRVLGFRSVEEQETFEQAFFRREAGFRDFALYRLRRDTVTYLGDYAGDREVLEEQLPGREFAGFRINHVYWFNDILELDVERVRQPAHAETSLFPPQLRPPEVTKNYEYFRAEFPKLSVPEPAYAEVEDNGWLRRANLMPLDAILYGFVDSRGDADFFVAEELREKEELRISWYRMGRTNLRPLVRIYDETGRPVRSYTPRNYIQFRYRVPKGQHQVTIEVGDRFRGFKGDSGGYLNFHYLLSVQRRRPD